MLLKAAWGAMQRLENAKKKRSIRIDTITPYWPFGDIYKTNQGVKILIMNNSLRLILLCHLAILHQSYSLTLLDTFDGSGGPDSSKWTYANPYSDSSVYQSDGYLNLLNRGTLFSKSEFGSDIEISGSMKFTGSDKDLTRLLLRTDKYMTPLNASSQLTHGILIGFAPGYGAGISEFFGFPAGSDNPADPDGWEPLAATTGTGYFSMNVEESFKVTDDGYTINLYLRDMNTPVATATSTLRYGGYFAIQNREGGLGGSWESNGSNVSINSLNIVPEPSAFSLLAIGLGGLAILRRRRS